jgi:hypothetical protein
VQCGESGRRSGQEAIAAAAADACYKQATIDCKPKIVLRMPTIAQASTAANSHNRVLVSAKLLTQRWMCSFHSVCVCVGRRRGVEEVEEEEEEAIATQIQKMCAVEEQMDKNGPG